MAVITHKNGTAAAVLNDPTRKNVKEVKKDVADVKEQADETAQHFWNKNGPGTDPDAGAHVTEYPRKQWSDPDDAEHYHKGANILFRSNSVKIRNGLVDLAEFTESHVLFRDEDGNIVAAFGRAVELISGNYHVSLTGDSGLELVYGEDGIRYGAMAIYSKYTDNEFLGFLYSQNKLTIRADEPGDLSQFASVELDGPALEVKLHRDASVDRDLDVGRKLTAGNIDCGYEEVVPTANTPTKKTVTFNKTFTNAPHVVATAHSKVPGSIVQGVSVDNITTTGFDLYVYRTNTTTTAVEWIAIGE